MLPPAALKVALGDPAPPYGGYAGLPAGCEGCAPGGRLFAGYGDGCAGAGPARAFTGGSLLNSAHMSMMTSTRLECSGTQARAVSTRPRVLFASGCSR